jgi:hypothetical protein
MSWTALVPVLGPVQRAGGQIAAAAKGATAAIVFAAAGVLPMVNAAASPPSLAPSGNALGDDDVRSGGIGAADGSGDPLDVPKGTAGGSSEDPSDDGSGGGSDGDATGDDLSDGGTGVDDPAGTVNDIVEEMSGTVDAIVDGTTDASDGLVDAMTDTVNGVVDGTTDAVDGVLGSDVSGVLDEPLHGRRGWASRVVT